MSIAEDIVQDTKHAQRCQCHQQGFQEISLFKEILFMWWCALQSIICNEVSLLSSDTYTELASELIYVVGRLVDSQSKSYIQSRKLTNNLSHKDSHNKNILHECTCMYTQLSIYMIQFLTQFIGQIDHIHKEPLDCRWFVIEFYLHKHHRMAAFLVPPAWPCDADESCAHAGRGISWYQPPSARNAARWSTISGDLLEHCKHIYMI